jgi:hypothetical protein
MAVLVALVWRRAAPLPQGAAILLVATLWRSHWR